MTESEARIERVFGGGFPRYYGEEPETYWAKVERQAEALHRAGVTHVSINDVVVSAPLIMDPENSYLRFTTYAHPMDRYVASTYNIGIYHPSLLDENRKLLTWNAKLAQRYGFRCWMWMIEVTFLPESFFQRYPELRGPRVDNPACSHTPLFALCPEVPAVQDHYRQLTRQMLELAPELDEMHVFTCDSGGGFCYGDGLYAGPNGPAHCRHIPTGKQAQTFCRTVLEAGQEVNPGFRVVMTSGLSHRERKDFLEGAPPDVSAYAYGAFSWTGGLEDRWANMMMGPAAHTPEGRTQARAWQDADMKARLEAVRASRHPLYAWYTTGDWAGPAEPPYPYQVHEIMGKYLTWGARNLSGGGTGERYDANSGILVQAMTEGPGDAEAAVHKLAVEWVGEALADRLCAVWRLSDHADRERPMSPAAGCNLYRDPFFQHHPIVPDLSQLGEHDLDYFLTPVIRDETTMRSFQGGLWRLTHLSDANKRYLVRQLEEVVLPAVEEALGLLDEMLAEAGLTAEQRACLEAQRRPLGIQCCYYGRTRNLFQASFHVCAGSQPYEGLPPLPDLIQADVDNSLRWYAFEEKAEPREAPRERLMIEHRKDPIRPVNLTEFPYPEYPGLEGWRGEAAHLTGE